MFSQSDGMRREIFSRGVGVDLAAARLDLREDVPCISVGTSLEKHVLQEMCQAGMNPIVAAAGAHKKPGGDRTRSRAGNDDYLETIWKCFELKFHVP